MDVIETARLRLRRWQADDLERLVRLYADPRVSRYLNRDGRPLPREATAAFHEDMLRQWDENGFGPWAALDRRSGRWLGEIGLNTLRQWTGPHKVEVGWELDPSVWGRGLATEGGRAAVRYGFEVVGLERVISVTVPGNAASRRVMEKCGLTLRGEHPYKDTVVVWYALDRADYQARRREDREPGHSAR